MARLKTIAKTEATDAARRLLDGVEKKMGRVPNLMATLANSPAALEAYLGFSNALSKGTLPARLREQLALTVGEANGCQYCLAAHTALGRMAGLADQDIADSRHGVSPDRKTEAVLRFARKVVAERGRVSDEDVESVRAAGAGDDEIAETVATVALNIFTNYFNHVADTEVDFPAVEPAQSPACAC